MEIAYKLNSEFKEALITIAELHIALGQTDDACRALLMAKDSGSIDRNYILSTSIFENIRNERCFVESVGKYPSSQPSN